MQAEPWKALMSMLRTILVAHTRAACGRCAVGQEATEREDLSGQRARQTCCRKVTNHRDMGG